MTHTYVADVRITPRGGILDPEGETIARALENLGYQDVSEVRAGRLIRLTLAAADPETARTTVERMCEELIANPLIEEYLVTLEETDGDADAAAGSAPGAPAAEAGP